jgi:hypothetical protein
MLETVDLLFYAPLPAVFIHPTEFFSLWGRAVDYATCSVVYLGKRCTTECINTGSVDDRDPVVHEDLFSAFPSKVIRDGSMKHR